MGRVAGRLEIPHRGAVILSNRGNLNVHFTGTGIVARAMARTALMRRDPAAWLAREAATAAAIAGIGAPVVSPVRSHDPGPYLEDGIAVSLWTFVAPGNARARTAHEAVETLVALHEIDPRHVDIPIPVLTPVHEAIPESLTALAALAVTGTVNSDVLRRLLRHVESVVRRLEGAGGRAVILHGDPHPGNLVHDGCHWRWLDLESVCLGPPEWDLAVLYQSNRLAGPEMLRRYGELRGMPAPSLDELAPFLHAKQLDATVWAVGMAHFYPDQYATLAMERLGRLERVP
jgi:aminoglycoside phosphotransferase (APT) family kinase protein